MSDVAAYSAADGGSLEDFFYGNARRLVRLAHLLGADDPEDAVQEAFCKVLAARRSTDIEKLSGYINTVVVNEVRSRQRRQAVARRKQTYVVPETSTSDPVEAVEARSVLLAALDDLAPRQREALVLRYWMDLPLADIAGAMGVRLGTVKSLISRGMGRLAADLEDYR